jgi:hypothetical protein
MAEGDRRHDADAGNGHQALRRLVSSCHLPDLAVHRIKLFADVAT